MLHFEVKSRKNIDILNNLSVSYKDITYYNFLNSSCINYLSQSKKQIEINNKGWDIFKKVTNPYEYIHTSIDNVKISKYRPLSRAFYKMMEMINFFNLIKDTNNSLETFHVAEGPGGFIEAVNYYRKRTINPFTYNKDQYYGMTLVDDDNSKIPGWCKSTHFISTTIPVKIEYGESGDGDIYKLENLDYIYNNHRNNYSLVTGDGGFDFSEDFNKQESIAMKLILCEIIYGIILTKVNGNFVVKIFDLFTLCSYEIIHLLSCIFSEIYICKPETSRYGNSEKYLICKGKYKDVDYEQYTKLRNFFIKINNYNDEFSNISILNVELPMQLKNKIQEINCIFTERQVENINDTLSLIDNNKKNEVIEAINTKHIQLSINWCKKHNIPYNEVKKQNLFT